MNDLKEQYETQILGLFWKYGIKSVTMDDIANHLSISKKTLYQYFKDKNDLVLSTTKRHFEMEKEMIMSAKRESKDPIEEIVKISSCIRMSAKDINPASVFDIKKYYAEAWQLIGEYKEIIIRQQFTENLKEGIEQGFYRKDINIELMTRLKIVEMDLVFDSNCFEIEGQNPIEISLELTDHFMRGLFTEKGLKQYETYITQTN